MPSLFSRCRLVRRMRPWLEMKIWFSMEYRWFRLSTRDLGHDMAMSLVSSMWCAATQARQGTAYREPPTCFPQTQISLVGCRAIGE
jgi:hypothetical protein